MTKIEKTFSPRQGSRLVRQGIALSVLALVTSLKNQPTKERSRKYYIAREIFEFIKKEAL